MLGKKSKIKKDKFTRKEEKLKAKEAKLKHKFEKRKKIKARATNFYNSSRARINKSLKLQLLSAIAICFIASIFTSFIVLNGCKSFGIGERSYIEYDSNRSYMEMNAMKKSQAIALIENLEIKIEDTSSIEELIMTLNSYDETFSEEESLKINDLITTTLYSYTTSSNVGLLFDILYENSNEDITNDIKLITDYLLKLKSENRLTKENVNNLFYDFITNKVSLKDIKFSLLKDIFANLDGKVYFVDSSGNIILKNNSDFIEKINIEDALEKSLNNNSDSDFFLMYPTVFNGNVHYLINMATLTGYEVYYYSSSIGLLAILSGTLCFILLLFKLIKNKLEYIQYISQSLKEISTGNLNYEVTISGEDELSQVAENINYMESELKNHIEKENAAQKTKNELITNVSHDLRTPLTLIIGYLGLVKDKNFNTEEEMSNYLNIAYSRAENLKSLIDDLFEYTKLSNRGIELNKSTISINNLLIQLTEEMLPIANEKQMDIISNIPKDRIELQCDVQKITRVFENLIGNAIKYNHENTPININLKNSSNSVIISITNKSTDIKEEELPKLFDRFYRAEESRNTSTGGSGLGLAISKTIVELHGGTIWAELQNDIISFNVSLLK